jgi:hypothetical protein
MNRDDALLQGLKHKLYTWLAYIGRASLATEAKIEPATNNEFYLVVRWEKPSPGEYRKLFDRPYVFGSSLRLDRNAWEVRECVGVLAREVVREVLSFRGV